MPKSHKPGLTKNFSKIVLEFVHMRPIINNVVGGSTPDKTLDGVSSYH
jgi:hypothetical protein